MNPRGALALLLLAVAAALLSPAAPVPRGIPGAATFAGAALAQDTTGAGGTAEAAIPDYTGYVNDLAGILDQETRAKLEAFLDQLQRKTGAQFAVLTVKSTAPLA